MSVFKIASRIGQACLALALLNLFFLPWASYARPKKPLSVENPEVGKDFLLSFCLWWLPDPRLHIYLSALEDTTSVTITCRDYPLFNDQFTLLPHTDTTYVVPKEIDVRLLETEKVTGKVIRVRSTSPVICIADPGELWDRYAGVSEDKAGTNFRILTAAQSYYDPILPIEYAEVPFLEVSAFYPSSQITITPTEKTINGSPKGVPLTFLLDSGECVYLRSEFVEGNGRDLTGTTVTSTLPVAVVSGHPIADVPLGYGTGGNALESMPPISQLGKGYIFQLSIPRARPDTNSAWYPGTELVRVLAVKNNTEVQVNGKHWGKTLMEGEYIDTLITGTALIEANEPILAGDYSHSAYSFGDTIPGGAFLAVLPSLENRCTDQTFFVPSELLYPSDTTPFYTAQYVQVAVERSNKSNVHLDGELIADSLFTDVPGSFSGYEFSVGSIRTSPARQHRLTVPGKTENGFVFMVYGASGSHTGGQAAYAYGSQMLYRKTDALAVKPDNNRNNYSSISGIISAGLYRRNNGIVLRLGSPNDGEANIELYDITGRLILQNSYHLIKGTQDILLPNHNIAHGVYLLHMKSGSNEYSTKVLFSGL